ncbi:hypothetical protein BJY01DRAFT_213793 [Aspergillus pseudoustus]|uniref:Mid2 domain-containing protein n=1 Tax=Aspergillus pseudoustus TaxID=1810923 RepID=A0ABR4K2C2_9EURO
MNICWNKVNSEVGLVYEDELNKLYSSLTADDPSATTYAFDLASLLPITASSSFSSPRSLSVPSSQTEGVITTITIRPDDGEDDHNTSTFDTSRGTTTEAATPTPWSPEPSEHSSSSLTPSTLGITITDSSTTTTPTLSPNTSNSPGPGPDSSSGLSGGAIAGIGIAAIVVAAIVLGGIFLLLRPRNSRGILRLGAGSGSGSGAEIYTVPAELDSTRPVEQAVYEAYGRSIRRPRGSLGPHELPIGARAL